MTFEISTILLLTLCAGLCLLLWRLIKRRKGMEPRARFRKVSNALLADFLIPDGEGGEIHIENALLCKRGIVIVNIKDVAGNIFGSDTMDEWAVITGEKRFTFRNPQPGLYDRLAAVRRIVPDVPVEGFVAFTHLARFSKGYPAHAIELNTLLNELEQEHAQQSAAPEAFWPSWEALVKEARVTRVDELASAT